MQRSALCRSRRELSNECLLAKFGFDTAENEPCKVCPLSVYESLRSIIIITDRPGGSIDVEEFIEGLTNIVTSGITVEEMKRRKQLDTCTEKILEINKKVDLVQENLEERVKALDEKIDASRDSIIAHLDSMISSLVPRPPMRARSPKPGQPARNRGNRPETAKSNSRPGTANVHSPEGSPERPGGPATGHGVTVKAWSRRAAGQAERLKLAVYLWSRGHQRNWCTSGIATVSRL